MNQTNFFDPVGMPKKQKQPQTHQEHEVQTLVDRIEKKASALSKRNLHFVRSGVQGSYDHHE
jgi:hypothetical protein